MRARAAQRLVVRRRAAAPLWSPPSAGGVMSDGARQPLQVLLALEGEPGADPEEIERLSRQLRAELLELDVDRVAAVPAGPSPPGAKGDAVSVAQWLLTLSATGGVFATVVATVRDWLG